jgi:hypothetical protein
MTLMNNLDNIRYELEFSDWQKMCHYTKKYDNISIHTLLRIFINDGLISFIMDNGYHLFVNKSKMGDLISSYLFYDKNNIRYNFPNNNSYDESYNDYKFFLKWRNFWKYWNHNTDNFFEDYEEFIEDLVWHLIDLEKSSAYLDNLEESESEDEQIKKEKKIDPYILDQMNKIYYRRVEE